jgi:hypothetical protein
MSLNDALDMGGDYRYHDDIGHVIKGTYNGKRVQQEVDFETKEKRFWDEDHKEPVNGLVLLMTDENGEDFEFFCNQVCKAQLAKWVKETGTVVEEGGIFAIKLTDKERTPKGFKRNVYAFNYTAPVAAAVSAADF